MRNTDEFLDSVSNSYTDFMDEYAKNAEGFVSNFGDGVAVAEFNIPPITPERKVPSEKLEEELSKKLANYSVITKIPE